MNQFSLRIRISIAAISVLLASCGNGGDGSTQTPSSTASPSNAATTNSEAEAASDNSAITSTTDDLDAAVASVEADILGVRLGMTPDAAEAALKANESVVDVTQPGWNTLEPEYSSGWPPITADTPGAFVRGIRATTGPGNTAPPVIVGFARPPADNLVVSIDRKERYSSSGPQTSLDTYRQALIEKYGPPTEEDNSGVILLLKWLYPSNANDCTPLRSNLPASKQMSSYPDDMGHPPASCASTLLFSLTSRNGIVNNMEARLANVGQQYLYREAYMAYEAELRRKFEAAKRQQATDKPNL